MTDNIEALLEERGKTHGDYTEHARCTQNIMRALVQEKNWSKLSDIQLESLHMFAHKMGRIMVGNPDELDHWDDIAGYAKLVSQRLKRGTGGAVAAGAARVLQGAGAPVALSPAFDAAGVGAVAATPPARSSEEVAMDAFVERTARRIITVRGWGGGGPNWFKDTVGWGSMSGSKWSELYYLDDEGWHMIYAHQAEYGKVV